MHLPISDLSPSVGTLTAPSIKAVITLVWPYSSSSRSFAFILAEEDVRLRRSKGQVRVVLRGSSAKAAAGSRLGIGDLVVLRLDGVEWKKHDENVRTPGKSLDWDLEFQERIYLEAYRDGHQFATIDVDHPPLSPVRPAPLPTYSPEQTRSAILIDETPTKHVPDIWPSPAFLKHSRVSSVSFLNPSYDPFADDDGYILGKGRKRTKLSQQVDTAGGAEVLSPAGTSSRARTSLGSQDEVNAPATMSTMEDAETQTTFAVPDDSRGSGDEGVEMHTITEVREETQTNPVSREDGASTAWENVGASVEAAKEPPLASETLSTQESDGHQNGLPEQLSQPSEPLHVSTDQAESPSESENNEVTPERMTTPRLGPLASPGLPLVSPLLNRPGGYFPFPSETTSQLDAASNTPTLDYPHLPPFEATRQQVPEEATPSHPLDEAKDDSVVKVDEDSEESHVEDEPGTVEFEASRLDVPQTPDNLIDDQAEEDNEFDSDQDMYDEEPVSDFEGFSTPGGPLKASDEEDEMIEEGSESDAETGESGEVEEDPGIEGRAEMPNVTYTASESEEESGSEDEEDREEQLESQGLEKSLVGGTASDVEHAHTNGNERPAAPDDRGYGISRSDQLFKGRPESEELDQSEDEEDSEMEDYSEEKDEDFEAEEPEEQPIQRLHVHKVDEIIDLTEDSDSDEEPAEVSPKGQGEEEKDGSDGELEKHSAAANDHAHEKGRFEDAYSRTDSFSYSSVDEVAIEQREDMPTSPVMDDDYESERQPSLEEEELEQALLQADVGDVSYPELPLPETEPVEDVRHDGALPFENTREAAETLGVLIDPRLSNQLMTPTATATESQLTSLLSRQSTALAQEDDHLLPTPQDTQITAKITVSQSTLLSLDGPRDSSPAPGELEEELAESLEGATNATPSPSMKVPDEMSMWFDPKRSSQIQATASEADNSASEEDQKQQSSHDEAEEILLSSPQLREVFSQDLPEPKGFTTPHAYFPLLSSLQSHFNTNVDIMAVCTTHSPKPQRSKSGPKDYFTTLTLTDPPSLATPHPKSQLVTVGQIFRPYAKALPSVSRGDVVLLRAFKVQSQKHSMMLLSTEESGWVVFKDANEQNVASGPPVEFGAEERGFVKGLKVWWAAVGEKKYKEVDRENASEEITSSPEAVTKRMTRSSGSPENGARMVTRSMGPAGFSAINGRS